MSGNVNFNAGAKTDAVNYKKVANAAIQGGAAGALKGMNSIFNKTKTQAPKDALNTIDYSDIAHYEGTKVVGEAKYATNIEAHGEVEYSPNAENFKDKK